MTWRLWLSALLISLPAAAQESTRYVSDEISIMLRAGPGADSAPVGSLASGARLELLEARGGYARVRAADGREGWVSERYLERQPAAHERVQRVEQELAGAQQKLAQAQAGLQDLQTAHDKLLQDFSRIAESPGALAAPGLAQENEQLRAQVERLEQEAAAQTAGRASALALDARQTLMLGGALVAGGALIALLLAQLWPRRRW